ncbi:MAG TPA: DNA polymerase III subunit delta [Dehalococcoidia bacterium]|nr:DNA polymerase III subunit delta [Dehalococcoidia bacterium]
MLYVLHGEDDFSLHQALEEIKRSIGDATALATNTTVLDGHQVTVSELGAVCAAMPFLGERRLVIINGLLERFEPKAKPSRRKKADGAARQDEYKLLGEYLLQVPESTVLVLVDGKIKGSNPLLRQLSPRAKVMSFPLLRDIRLRQWIEKRVAEKGGSISPQAVELLARYVGGNLWIMAGEIDKLVLFASGRRIEEDDVRRVVSYAQEASVFAMVDAILEFRAGAAEQLLQQLLQQGAAPAYLLVMLARQVRLIVRLKELGRQRRPQEEIQDKLEVASEFVMRKAREQATRYSLARLKEVYHRLLQADVWIKTGKYEAELALNILIAELCQPRKLAV